VIGACYAYWSVDFPEFDRRILRLLRCGLHRSILVSALFSVELPRILLTLLISGTLTLLLGLLRHLVRFLRFVTSLPTARLEDSLTQLSSALPIWGSLTTAFERALKRTLLGTSKMSDVKRPDLEVVINACDQARPSP
jgi:NTE family protein